MNLKEQLHNSKQDGDELKLTIKDLEQEIRDFYARLDDSKNKNQEELQSWQSKYELLERENKQLKYDKERVQERLEFDLKRITTEKQSEIDELKLSLVNYEQRAIELNVQN